jgi:hypothetical protein
MCDNIRGIFGFCGYEATAYIARCPTAIQNQVTCPPYQREDVHDWQQDEDNADCPACKGVTPPETSPRDNERVVRRSYLFLFISDLVPHILNNILLLFTSPSVRSSPILCFFSPSIAGNKESVLLEREINSNI